ncbi:dipeptidase [Fuerstiella marisgermanici]|uniref:Membrane dipeptidase (Peptidase family M19) n=1 Tax=Fuerstiella marisgermanici TaxID=1891926 RepID=A0A1P8WDC6_9PLAN|nr:dipeptidase [Fuerstiella marisgermanici]APZ92044.1 Membrane dipeptidase (Peptidase family M19) [Fuerstiella marisgermanici]
MLRSPLFLMLPLLATTVFAEDKQRSPVVLTEHGREVHSAGMLFDGHNDLPWQMREIGSSSFDVFDIRKAQPKLHTDIDRLRKGGVKAQFWSVYVPAETDKAGTALLQTTQQIDLVENMVKRYSDVFEMASTPDDVERIVKSGKIASMMGIEGGYSIENSLDNIKRLYDRGCRYMTLTHSKSLEWADSATDEPRCGGLSEFGEAVIAEMNRVGMLIDLSHVSAECMRKSLAVTKAPVIFSHSSARALNKHPRNVPDDILKMMPDNGGVVMVNFYSKFVIPTKQLEKDDTHPGSIHDVVDHIEHIINVAGIDHVGIGSDFDGVPRLPDQLEDVSTYPLITQELLNRGHSAADIHKLMGTNVMRVLRAAEAVRE